MIFRQLQTEHNSQIVESFHLAIQRIIVGERLPLQENGVNRITPPPVA